MTQAYCMTPDGTRIELSPSDQGYAVLVRTGRAWFPDAICAKSLDAWVRASELAPNSWVSEIIREPERPDVSHYIKILQAYQNGQPIEYMFKGENNPEWHPYEHDGFDFINYKYRIVESAEDPRDSEIAQLKDDKAKLMETLRYIADKNNKLNMLHVRRAATLALKSATTAGYEGD